MTVDEFWVQVFGNSQVGIDFAERKIMRYEYDNENSPYGWNTDHILPLKGNKKRDVISNIQITAIRTNREKGDATTFEIDGRRYQVKRRHNVLEDDILANYPYERLNKAYWIVVADEYYIDEGDDNYDDDD